MPKINQKEYESEETEVKNVSDVIEKVERNINAEGRPDNEKALMRLIINDLEKLDEPEVLSQELPVIPKFVADYLCRAKTDVTLMRVLEIASTREELPKWKKEYDWISKNDETFARAWLDGYEVEEEQKYILSIRITDKPSKTNYETFLNKRGIFHSMENESFNSEEFNWSEEEIRGLTKGDILFEHFAVKVEELEE